MKNSLLWGDSTTYKLISHYHNFGSKMVSGQGGVQRKEVRPVGCGGSEPVRLPWVGHPGGVARP